MAFPQADGAPTSYDDLRKTLETVRRTGQAHMEAIRKAEAALSSTAAQLAGDQRELKQEAEALARGRADFEEHLRSVPTPPQHVEANEALEGVDQQPCGRIDRSRSPKGQKAFSRQSPPPPVFGGEGHDRSKPYRAGEQSQSCMDFDLEAALVEHSLDETAKRVLRGLPVDQARHMLNLLDASVRNPSAFIMSRAKHAAGRAPVGAAGVQGRPGVPPGTSPDVLEQHCVRLGVDRSATQLLAEIPLDQALDLLQQINEDVHNPSACITAEVRKRKLAMHNSGATPRFGASKVPCKYYQEGRCRNGEDCRFAHD